MPGTRLIINVYSFPYELMTTSRNPRHTLQSLESLMEDEQKRQRLSSGSAAKFCVALGRLLGEPHLSWQPSSTHTPRPRQTSHWPNSAEPPGGTWEPLATQRLRPHPACLWDSCLQEGGEHGHAEHSQRSTDCVSVVHPSFRRAAVHTSSPLRR